MSDYVNRHRQALAVSAFIGLAIAASVGTGYLSSGQLPGGCSTGERPEWDGSAWQCRRWNDYRSTYLEWSNEFLTPDLNDWEFQSVSGTGATFSVLNTSAFGSRLGVGRLILGTTNTGISARRSSNAHNFSALTSAVYFAATAIPTLSTSSERFATLWGYVSSDTVNQTGGCYFLYDEGNVATGGVNSSNLSKLEAFAVDGSSNRTRVLLNGVSQDGTTGGAGSITTCNTSIVAQSGESTGWHTLRVEMNGTSSCAFYYDDALCTTLTTNIPTTSTALGAGVVAVKSVGTTSREVYLDAHRLRVQLTGARSP